MLSEYHDNYNTSIIKGEKSHFSYRQILKVTRNYKIL